MTRPEQAGGRDGINLFGRKYGLIEDPYPLYDQKQADEFVADIEKLIEATCLEVIGESEDCSKALIAGRNIWHIEMVSRNDLKAQQRQALSKLLERGEDV